MNPWTIYWSLGALLTMWFIDEGLVAILRSKFSVSYWRMFILLFITVCVVAWFAPFYVFMPRRR